MINYPRGRTALLLQLLPHGLHSQTGPGGKKRKKPGPARPSSSAAASRTSNTRGPKQLCLGRTPPRVPRPAQAAPEAPRARRKRPGLKAAARAHKGRPAGRPPALPVSPRLRPLSSPRHSAGLHSRGRTHSGGVALRGPPPLPGGRSLASAPASARLPGWAVTAYRPPRPPRSGPLLRPLRRLPGARGRTPPSSGSPRPFPLPRPESQNNWSRAGAGRKRKTGRAEAARGDAGVRAGACQGACAEPGRRGHPAAGAQAWPGGKRFRTEAVCGCIRNSVLLHLFLPEASPGDTCLQTRPGVRDNGTQQQNTPGS
ncbi:translation initiation factor IF-2-like [Mesocricetus auratus]|uniref:Translation initiation factor IF-2-like n=1 Tax=Mesocricetus auratus TaxID=10036 RepID=A0ABM2WX17_MESAU|nr:translation initiation factor IF-2-like [Mesocricetus auratus]